jgi:hypothetical protein
MVKLTSGRGAAPTAPRPEYARLDSKPAILNPSFETPQSRCPLAVLPVQRQIHATEYEAQVIAAQCRLSRPIAPRVVELIGMGVAA